MVAVRASLLVNYKQGKAIVMKMICEETWRAVPNYIRGNFSADLRACIEKHLKGCRHCTAALGGTGTRWEALFWRRISAG